MNGKKNELSFQIHLLPSDVNIRYRKFFPIDNGMFEIFQKLLP